ncbi:MAG TPA: HNH endonuclease signature motif containing protein [Parafilimonas sp.]|nr:HNH endonuclease signature motif containing protein [Parafilimonas sp.]
MATLLNKSDLLYTVAEAVKESGWNIIYLNNEHPFKIKIFKDTESLFVRIIIYNITHGGGYMRAENEYRIQWKIRELEHVANYYKTLILGYYQPLNVFAGWDISKHPSPKYSASFQIKVENLEKASVSGFSPCDKGNEEIAIAFRPDFFAEYVRNLEALHTFGESSNDFNILEEVTESETLVNDDIINSVSPPRQKALKLISENQRDKSFRARILRAYNNRCAFTGIQLKLVDAAHIIPVGDETSTDETMNGIALSASYHRAYDAGLITFTEEYNIVYNRNQTNKLEALNLVGGIETFLSNLREVIDVPPDRRDRPHRDYISKANRLRGWNN